MTDLPDEVQREFEVGPDRKLLSICIARRGHVYLIDNYAMDKVQKVVDKWRKRIANAKPVKGTTCLTCDTSFLRHTGNEPEAYAVALPTAKMHVPGRTAALVAGFCAKCSARSDDELIEIARQRWAPPSVPLAEGKA